MPLDPGIQAFLEQTGLPGGDFIPAPAYIRAHRTAPSALPIDSQFVIDAEPPAVGLICIYGHGEPVVQPGMFATPFRALSLDRLCALLRAS
jgi:hypothetical protein